MITKARGNKFMSYKILVLPGDGIGIECMAEVQKIMNWFKKKQNVAFDVEYDDIGGTAYERYGMPFADETLQKALKADAVLLGAVGGPQWDNVDYDKRPEAGLLKIRKEMGLFANLRPALVFDALAEASTLKLDVVKGLDIMIVRELTGGVYFGEPRGIETLSNGEKRGINTQVYTTTEIQRIAKVAFDLAQKRSNRVCSVEKANVMESGVLWREVVADIHEKYYKNTELSHMYADNCAMQLVRNPRQFDVIVTDNLFGDILSDCAAMLTGSLGMLPSASLGAKREDGKLPALYEPVHGSAPDIAGQGKANPLATILSFSMMLRYSFDLSRQADALDIAVEKALTAKRTGDIMAEGCELVSTSQMGDAVISELNNLI